MVQPSQKFIRSSIQRPFVKPSSPVCKRLFDFPDPNETKRMIKDMFESESRRLKDLWDFDSRVPFPAAVDDAEAREDDVESPIRSKVPRFEWELPDQRSVPQFYTRPVHPHRSEARNLQRTPVKKNTSRIQKLFQERQQRKSPLPLSCRDENASPVKTAPCPAKRAPSRRAPMFMSPPRITSGNINPSLARLVTALRVPLPTSPQLSTGPACPATPPKAADKKMDDVTTVKSNDVTEAPSAQGQVTVNEVSTVTSKRPASRQLFAARQAGKRSRDECSSKQPKLTELIPQRKLRSATKRTRQEQSATSSQAQVPASVTSE